jgi:hypothetical protein
LNARIPNPCKKDSIKVRVLTTEKCEKVANNFHVAVAERARGPVTDDVAINRVIENRVRATVGLKSAVGATRQRFHNRRLSNVQEFVAAEDRSIIVPVYVA